jgi:methyltransferase (TIGR00027 family)
MKPGHASRTAVLVAMGRAAAHDRTTVTRFSDPTALALLPDDARTQVEWFRRGIPPTTLRARLAWGYLERQSHLMVARTVAIDDAVRAAALPQLVILGAGLDGRAWRIPELREVVVFEVDHPDTQREKRGRVSALLQAAREVRFVPVDFTRDDLDQALAAAGHDATRPTTWLWEGVVMYLTRAEIAATLAVIARRSAAESRLIIAYHRPALMLFLVGWMVRRVGEPLRTALSPGAMRALLERYGFAVVRDQGLPEIGAALSSEVGRATRIMKHLRIVTATRVSGG